MYWATLSSIPFPDLPDQPVAQEKNVQPIQEAFLPWYFTQNRDTPKAARTPPQLPALSPACLGSPDRLDRQTCYSPCPSGWGSFGFVPSLEEIRDSCLTASFPSQDLLANPSNPAQLGIVRGVGAVWQTERHLSGRPRGTLPKN